MCLHVCLFPFACVCSGLIVVGVAVVRERAIDIEDFAYLLALFVALYIIRGIVIISAYPVLRSVSSAWFGLVSGFGFGLTSHVSFQFRSVFRFVLGFGSCSFDFIKLVHSRQLCEFDQCKHLIMGFGSGCLGGLVHVWFELPFLVSFRFGFWLLLI